jgi:predicted acylesterase/phospholipase RssA
MIQQISSLSIEICQPDILIKIPMNSFGPFLFYKSEEIILAGELATRKALLDFKDK